MCTRSKNVETRILANSIFAHLQASLLDEILWREMETRGVASTVRQLASGAQIRINVPQTREALIRAGTHLIRSGQLTNHLEN
jgi:hypothetical protein